MLSETLNHVTGAGTAVVLGVPLLAVAPNAELIALCGVVTTALQLINTYLINRKKNKNG